MEARKGSVLGGFLEKSEWKSRMLGDFREYLREKRGEGLKKRSPEI